VFELTRPIPWTVRAALGESARGGKELNVPLIHQGQAVLDNLDRISPRAQGDALTLRYRLISRLMMHNREHEFAARDKDSRMDAGDNIEWWD
jgi:hypothetical protein